MVFVRIIRFTERLGRVTLVSARTQHPRRGPTDLRAAVTSSQPPANTVRSLTTDVHGAEGHGADVHGTEGHGADVHGTEGHGADATGVLGDMPSTDAVIAQVRQWISEASARPLPKAARMLNGV